MVFLKRSDHTHSEASIATAVQDPEAFEPALDDEAELDMAEETAETPLVASALVNGAGSVPQSAKRPPDSRTFEEAVTKYHGKVFQLVYRYTGDYEEACDLTQDTFVRAYNAWGEFRGDSQIYTWLYRIAINLCHNQQKKLNRRQRVERNSLDAPNGDDDGDGWSSWGTYEVADERPLPLQILESQELRVRLQEALCELPDNYRTVIVLRDIEGLSYDEIARVTDSTLEAIKSRLFRARSSLRQMLTPYLQGVEGVKTKTKAY